MIRIPDRKPTPDHSFAYTGRELDPEGGLYFYRHRHFEPTGTENGSELFSLNEMRREDVIRT